MGARGPVPKRTDQRRRRNTPDGPELAKVTATGTVPIPATDPEWHPIAQGWFDSLRASAQNVYYEPSDWATAVYVAEAMSRNLAAPRFSAQLFAAVSGAMTELLTTEGARRRVRLEIEREAPSAPPSVALMASYRAAADKS